MQVRDLIRTDHEFSRNGSREIRLVHSVITVLVHSALNSIGGKRTGGSIFFTPPELLFRVVSGLLGEVPLKPYCQRSGFRSSFDAAEESPAATRLEPQLRCLTEILPTFYGLVR
jgi:hypothetical protein